MSCGRVAAAALELGHDLRQLAFEGGVEHAARDAPFGGAPVVRVHADSSTAGQEAPMDAAVGASAAPARRASAPAVSGLPAGQPSAAQPCR